MTITAAIIASLSTKQMFRRKSWTHGDWLRIKGATSKYGGGELQWESGERAVFFYVDDLSAIDWTLRGDREPESGAV